MAISPSPSVTLDSKPDNPEPEKPTTDLLQSTQPDPSPASAPQSASSPSPSPSPSSDNPNNSNPPSTTTITTITPPSLPSFQSYTLPPPMTSASIPPPSAPSFRPILPQFSPVPVPVPNPQNPNFQNPNLQPPGVSVMLPGAASGGVGSLTVSVSPMRPLPPGASMYQVPPPGHPQPYGQAPNGYPPQAPQGSIPPPGIPRYPPQYTPMVRPVFPPRPPGPMGMLPPLSRPPVPGIRGVPPVIPPVVRPVIPIIAPTEKPQTTVYVGKIAPTVENDFILSLLRLCGPVKSWKRPQDPSNGTPRGFGFCEFESAEGVLRALRLLSKFNVDGQELMLNVNQATREYLERYVEKKTEREKLKEAEAEAEAEGTKKEEENAPGVEKPKPPKPLVENTKEDSDKVDKENQESSQNFGIVTDEDREADRDASDKLKSMLEERLKTKPLPPPPMLPPTDGSVKSNSEAPTKSRDDSDVDIMRNDAGDERNDDETTSENKPSSEHDRPDTSSPDRRRHDRRSRDRDRERDLKRDKERELERYEKERERERLRRERERDMKIREAERLYKERVKEWESRERDKEKQRLYEREKEKDRERQRKKEVTDQENESDDDDRRRRRRSSVLEEKRKKRKREKDDDREDRLREEEEIAEAKRRAIEEQQKKDEPKDVAVQMTNGNEKPIIPEEVNESSPNVAEQSYESDSFTGNHVGDVIMKNGVDDPTMSTVVSDTRQSTNAPARKLGFGLVGSGKRTTVPSVFHEEDEDEANKDKKMRPLVPIDYSNEELQAVQPPVSGAPPPNLAAAAEFAKRISNVNPKDERSEMERDRSRRSGDRSSQRERDRIDEDGHRTRDDNRDRTLDRDKDRESVSDKVKTPENKKLLDAKQLIDMIPKTKEELFSYEINWAVYDKHELHERMRPWISKKITEFLGEEEATLVDYIVSSTKEHVRASQMLELLQSILDDEAEMFVLKMWRMLIFEIKKVETGLALKPKA